jgi:hypothetical protein
MKSNFSTKTCFFFFGLAILGLFIINCKSASAETITSAQAGNWSATSTWTGGAVPGNGDFVTVKHNVVIDQNVGSVAGGGIKTIRVEGNTLSLSTSSPRTIIFGSTGLDPVGSGTTTNPGLDATMHGFFIAKGTLDLRAAAANPLTITTADDSSPFYIHHGWGDYVNGKTARNAATIRIYYADMYHLGANVSGFYGINHVSSSAGNVVDIRYCRITGLYMLLYSSGSSTLTSVNIISNTISGVTSGNTIKLVKTSNAVITDNTEINPKAHGKMVDLSYNPTALNFSRNAVLGTTSFARGGLNIAANTAGTGGNTIRQNIVVNVISPTNGSAKLANLGLLDTTTVASENIGEGDHQGIALMGTGTLSATDNFFVQTASNSAGQGSFFVSKGTLDAKRNIIAIDSSNINIAVLVYKGSTNPPTGRFEHNTILGAVGSNASGIWCGETKYPAVNCVYRSNLLQNLYRGLINGDIKSTFNVATYGYNGAGVHHNNIYNVGTPYKDVAVSNGFDDGSVQHPSDQYADYSYDPRFLDSTRRVRGYDSYVGGPGTYEHLFAELAKRSSFGGTYNSVYDIENIRQWLFAGFAPTNTALKGIAHDGGDIGAVAVIE